MEKKYPTSTEQVPREFSGRSSGLTGGFGGHFINIWHNRATPQGLPGKFLGTSREVPNNRPRNLVDNFVTFRVIEKITQNRFCDQTAFPPKHPSNQTSEDQSVVLSDLSGNCKNHPVNQKISICRKSRATHEQLTSNLRATGHLLVTSPGVWS